MPFLDRLSKGVSKAAEQAKFEADKMMKTNKFGSELSELARQAAQINTSIGVKVIELQAAGKIQIPELNDLIAQLKNLEAQVGAKKNELEALKTSKFEDVAAAAAQTPTPAPAAPVASPVEAAPKCSNCGAAVQPGVKFCPSCGQKLA
jgi:hypothetical protein